MFLSAKALALFQLLIGIFIFSLGSTSSANEEVLTLKNITGNIYAIYGQLSDRTKENLGNNANFGFVVTEKGIVLIDSGASYDAAKAIHALIKTVSDKNITTVINTGGQDHRWLGNDYFSRLGARIIASKAAVTDHKNRVDAQFERLSSVLSTDNLKKTQAKFADIQFDKNYRFASGSTEIHIIHTGTAHTPGDSFIWLPQSKTVFSGDIIYTQRMLGVIPVSGSKSWLASFEAIKKLEPRFVIPGHGKTSDMASAIKDTYNYLLFLRNAVAEFIEQGKGIELIGSISQSTFSYLKNYEILKGRNAQKVFEEIEWE